jgi:hypothetical protein
MFHNKSSRIRHEKTSRLCSVPSSVVPSNVVLPLRVTGPSLGGRSLVVQHPAAHTIDICATTKETYLFAAALPNDNSEGDEDSDVLMASGYTSSSSSSVEEKKLDDDSVVDHEKDVPPYNFLAWLPVEDPDSLSYDEMASFRINSDDPALNKNPSESPFPRGDEEELLEPAVVSLDYEDIFCTAKFSGVTEGDLHPSQERLMVFLKDNCYPLSVYDFVHKWAQDSLCLGYDFKSKQGKTVMKKMQQKYQKIVGPPPTTTFQSLGEGLPQSPVTTWDIASQIRRVVSDPASVANATWEFTKTMDPSTGERIFGQFHSSLWWERAHTTVPQLKKPNNFLAPISIFIDSARLDLIGRKEGEPVIVELLNLSSVLRRTDASKLLLGFLPPYPKTSAERAKDRNKTATKKNYMEFYHAALRIVLKKLLEIEHLSDGLEVEIPNIGKSYLHVRLAFIVGDIKGQNPMACHFNGFSSNIAYILPSCNCSTTSADLVNEFRCEPIDKLKTDMVIDKCINVIETRQARMVDKARKKLESISKFGVKSAFRDFSFGGNPLGIYGSLPLETLHAWLLGLIEYLLQSVYSHVEVDDDVSDWCDRRYSGDTTADIKSRPHPKNATMKVDQAEFERRLKMAKEVSSRQSDRDVPKTPFNHGVTCLTRLTGQEYPGLVMLTMVCLDGMLPSRNLPNQNLIKRFSHLLWLTLSLNVCLNKPEKTASEVDDLERKTIKYLSLYRELVGPQREMNSRCGLRIVKMHALTHFAQQYRDFGNTATYFGGFLSHVSRQWPNRT